MLHSDRTIDRFNKRISYQSPAEPEIPRVDISTAAIDGWINSNCGLLKKLPLKLRLEIYWLALGRDAFTLVTVPWKVTAVPEVEGNVSMASVRHQKNVRSHGLCC